jgi:peptide chain release factor subunit 1
LIIPPGDQIARVNKMLTDEAGTASNIKSRVNRLSVLGAITSTQQKLKQYAKVPTNGLVIYCGEVLNDQGQDVVGWFVLFSFSHFGCFGFAGKVKKLSMGIEPIKPINTSLYMCDNRFHTEPLACLLESDQTFGFIVMDGSCTLFGTLSGNNRVVKQMIYVDLPKKHGRGGQSALRFARLRLEKRHNYLRKAKHDFFQKKLCSFFNCFFVRLPSWLRFISSPTMFRM